VIGLASWRWNPVLGLIPISVRTLKLSRLFTVTGAHITFTRLRGHTIFWRVLITRFVTLRLSTGGALCSIVPAPWIASDNLGHLSRALGHSQTSKIKRDLQARIGTPS